MDTTIEEPLLPPASPPDRVRNSSHSLDDNVLHQIRTLLINAGVTATMINLPDDIENGPQDGTPRLTPQLTPQLTPPLTPPLTLDSSMAGSGDADADIEKGTNSKMTSTNAKENNTDATKSKRTRDMWKQNWIRRQLSSLAKLKNSEIADRAEEYPLHEDICNMFFLSKNWSVPFWYSLLTVLWKLTLFSIMIYWIYRPGGWRDCQIEEHKEHGTIPLVKATQFLLIPVAIGITEELLISMDILSKVRWKKLDDYPQATRAKFFIANTLRGIDGLIWLFIIGSLMFYAVDILGMFLNFAALQFLQSVDNTAFDMAKGGYLMKSLENVATKVSTVTLPSQRTTWREYVDTVILFSLLILLIIMWAVVNFYDKDV
mmetsp:Transcript_37239/g.78013  ORF Transcript_37239/g.78013 Transcript_37239/m.78013 type:complete len:373 (+) Transcript_37239:206-1324(+)